MSFDNLTLTCLLVTLSYIVLLVMFSKTKLTSSRNMSPLTDRFINKAIRYRRRGVVNVQPATGLCNTCA